ncbi:MAG: translesion error-prone DNA polymerase V autoproteolytic subunit [Candidatus Kapabacteria bacterium]|nr:translesion error-prone DNA polymerase V autoproteolytic subunit [Candidatus Kapabacteria bacterium]
MTILGIYEPDNKTKQELPLFLESVSAGFPSPADDYLEGKLDLNEHLVRNPTATFFVRVTGDSMEGAGMYSGDILVVDRSLDPKDGNVIIAVIDGELTVKRLSNKNGVISLVPENPNYKPLKITEEMSFTVWGVVTNVIHSLL